MSVWLNWFIVFLKDKVMSVLIHITCVFGGVKMPEVCDVHFEGSIFE